MKYRAILAGTLVLALGAATHGGPIVFGPNSQGGYNAYMLVDPGANFATAINDAQMTFPGWRGLAASGDVGHIATYHSDAEHDSVMAIRYAASGNTYVGLTDDPSLASNAFEDGNNSGGALPANGTVAAPGERGAGWAWVPTNSLNTYHQFSGGTSIWGGGEPNNWSDSEHAAEIRFDTHLNDIGGGNVRPYIVEWDLDLALPPALDIGPSGGMGTWGIREVANNGVINSVATAMDSLIQNENNPAAGDRFEATDRTMINFHDPESPGSGGPNGGDLPYLSDTADDPSTTEVNEGPNDDFVLVANATIRIPEGEGGDYTFFATGDDGFRLKIKGQAWTKVNGSDAGHAFISGDELWYPEPTGNSNTYGVINLAPGDYEVEYVWFERAGGAYNELAAAKGDHGSGGEDFRLVGYVAPEGGKMATPGLDGQVSVEMTNPGDHTITNLAQAETALATGPTTVYSDTAVNYNDPGHGGPGSIGGDVPFPIDDGAGADDNRFAMLVTGLLDIPWTGTYHLGFQSDDGARLTIPGQTWTAIVESADPAKSQISGDDESILFDGGTGNSRTVGEIALAAGTHAFEFLYFEDGGGSYVELFGRYADFPLPLAYELLVTGGAMVEDDYDGLQLVPEPATLVLLGTGVALTLLGRRRR